jgi:uncharacterized protein YndB with AHSA1/START domain
MNKLTLVAEPGKHDIIMTREFNAPRELVYRTFTDPVLVPRWWGPSELVTVVDKMDVRMGGLWRYIQHDADGNEYTFRGVYHEILSPERLVFTFEWEGLPGHVMLESVSFAERDGRTLLTDVTICQTVEDRDRLLQEGMEIGTTESWDRFEVLLTTR